MRPPLHVGCKVEGCTNKHTARGYCNAHYKRVIVRAASESRNSGPVDREARLEDCRWMAEHGETLSGAACRLGIGRPALDTWLRKHDPETLRVLSARDAWPEESRATFHGVAS